MKLNIDVVPHDLDSAVKLIKEALDVDDIQYIKENDNPIVLHHGFGRWLRNEWSLWDRDTILVKWFIDNYQCCHADDLSGLILDALWCDIKGEPRNTENLVARYKEHWRQYGIDPATGEKVL